jgi:hypothetical protein
MSTAQEKKALFAAAYNDRPTVFVTFDAGHDLCLIPSHLKPKPRCVFQYGTDLPVPTHDLELTDEGIMCSLSFNGRVQPTFVPWGAVYCIHFEAGGQIRGQAWQQHIPEGAIDEIFAAATEQSTTTRLFADASPPTDAQRVQQPNGTFSLDQFRKNKAARGKAR